ncbi:MAG: methyltransferase domain-containing protein [Planctomycetes bacterium]|nr:methyltransferase domain-containing protein [Planctomycetota bacterium]
MGTDVNKAAYWDAIYREETVPGWDLGAPSPVLRHAMEEGRIKPGRVAVLGCGYGHDAKLLSEAGLTVRAFDISRRALEGARKRYGEEEKLRFLKADIFKLPKKFAGTFDYVYEYTCFCAIAIGRRAEYARAVHDLLKPGGTLFGCFYSHGRKGGPPFNVTPTEVRSVFGPLFRIRRLAVSKHSVDRRKGAELWAEFDKK